MKIKKTPVGLMRLNAAFLSFGSLILLGLQTEALASNYQIQNIVYTKVGEKIYDANEWRSGIPQIQVRLEVHEDVSSDQKIFCRAYFYDASRKLLVTLEKPNDLRIFRASGEDFGFAAPNGMKKKEPVIAQFSVPNELRDKKWSKVIVVFGDEKEAVAKAIPAAMELYDFPESKLVQSTKNAPGK